MAQKTAPLLPATDELLRQFGDRLRLARRRRRLSAKQVAQRAGMSPMTLRSLERGGSGVTMGAYLAVMQVLGIENDLGLLGQADPQGRALQDARLPAVSKKVANQTATPRVHPLPTQVHSPVLGAVVSLQPPNNVPGWREQGGFMDSDALAGLIDPLPPVQTKER